MRIVALIEQLDVIGKIPTHLGLWAAPAQSPRAQSIAESST